MTWKIGSDLLANRRFRGTRATGHLAHHSSQAEIWWTVRELNSHFHGCRPWVIPLYEPPIWGEMRESNSRDWSHNPVPKPFGQSRHKTSGAGRVNRTLVGEVQALCTATVLDQQTLELARSLELRSGAYRAPALPVELYQRSWRGDSNADHGLTRPAPFPLSYTSTQNSGGGGENCTPDDLLCRQMPCCLGYTASNFLAKS